MARSTRHALSSELAPTCPCLKLRLMANTAKPTAEQEPVLDALRQAAILRKESYRLYLAAFSKALHAGVGPSLIARYAQISPQAAVSMRMRLRDEPSDHDAPTSVDDVLKRVDAIHELGSTVRPAETSASTSRT